MGSTLVTLNLLTRDSVAFIVAHKIKITDLLGK